MNYEDNVKETDMMMMLSKTKRKDILLGAVNFSINFMTVKSIKIKVIVGNKTKGIKLLLIKYTSIKAK